MPQTLMVVHTLRDLPPCAAGERVVSFADYMNGRYPQSASRTRIINLSRSFGYLSEGYYCSLLAEARGHQVIPSVRTLNDLSRRSLYRLHIDDLDEGVFSALAADDTMEPVVLISYFGRTEDSRFHPLAMKLFEAFPCPLLEITLRRRKRWEISRLRVLSPARLDDKQQDYFRSALDAFSHKVWRERRKSESTRYDLAILVDPGEAMPPSNRGALKRFIRAGREVGVGCELISPRDYLRLAEYDGLLIRATTNIDHYTYRFAKKAESEGLVVIDDSNSILRCTNKIYLADLFRTHRVPSPRTMVLYKGQADQLDEAGKQLGFPVVVKVPDGSFSRGVEKAENAEQLSTICKRLFRQSTLLLAQEYVYTEFDWRIGVLDGRALFACRYYMVKRHWQIYRHGKRTDSGGFDAVPVEQVPPPIIDAALRATRPIGDSFYGVDIKERDGAAYVIEVNDNPNVDSGVEDKYLGMDLYRQIIATLLSRMEARRGH